MRKPRSDSKLDCLPLERKRELADMLLAGVSHKEALSHMREQWGVASSGPALTRFYASFCGEHVAERRHSLAGLAERVTVSIQELPVMWDELTLDTLRQLAFRLANNPQADPKDIKNILSLVLKARDQDLNARRIALLEAQISKAKTALEDKALTPEERQAKMREAFGIS